MIRPRRAALSAASLITAALVALSGCTPDGGADKGGAASPSATASASASVTPSPSASPTESPSPSATLSSAAPTPTPEAAEPPARKTHRTGGGSDSGSGGSGSGGSSSGGSGSGGSSSGGSGSSASDGVILAPSGNHYRRGQFCKKAHLGLTTQDAHGATLTCAMQSGRPHWQ
ncbi:hypothetical protein [Streptomyces rimosus]|uniref:hypothetical protein n=1 Tax=Streptomyces rimosus TaxID=1927 RepID=UPI000B18D04A|nr:hypothetical protein [Streptomyces rimosus]